MVFPGHIAGGYLAAKAVLAAATATGAVLTPSETTSLLVIGTIAGWLPDIDLVFFFLHHKYSTRQHKFESHRNFVTHAPAFWLAISLLVVLAGWMAASTFTELLGWLLLSGTWTHFFLDTFEYGIPWLWPFTDRRFAMREVTEPTIEAPAGTFSYYFELITKIWNKRITFALEVIVVIAALLVLLR